MSETYGQIIRRQRIEAGLKQKEVARRAGISQPDLCDSEKDNRPLSQAEFLRLQAAIVELIEERERAGAKVKAEVAG